MSVTVGECQGGGMDRFTYAAKYSQGREGSATVSVTVGECQGGGVDRFTYAAKYSQGTEGSATVSVTVGECQGGGVAWLMRLMAELGLI